MKPLASISVFAVTLLALGAGAAAVGSAVGPVAVTPAPAHMDGHADGHTEGGSAVPSGAADVAAVGAPVASPAGLQASDGAFTLELDRTTYDAGRIDLSFRILDEQGVAVRDFEVLHGEPMHLVVIDRDLQTFRHVHPDLSPDGTWSARLRLEGSGDHRVIADFQATGAPAGSTLGHDIAVAGPYRPAPLPRATSTDSVGDYEVTLSGRLVPGGTAAVEVRVAKDGRPVRDLQPYLEAYGHLVALRAGDLAYLHVHPAGTPGDGTTESGPEVAFGVGVPSAGTYRLFLDFKHGGRVRTAAFTATATADGSATTRPVTSEEREPGTHGESGDHAH